MPPSLSGCPWENRQDFLILALKCDSDTIDQKTTDSKILQRFSTFFLLKKLASSKNGTILLFLQMNMKMTTRQRRASTVAVVFTTVALLAVTGLGKVAVGFSGEPYWQKADPIFLLPKIQILPFLGLFEIVIAAFLIGLRETTQRLRIIYLVAAIFLAYRGVLWHILGNNSCNCSGIIGQSPYSALDFFILPILVLTFTASAFLLFIKPKQ